MPTGLELLLGGALCAFLACGAFALRRPGLGPAPFWVAGWISAGVAGLLLLAGDHLPHLQLLAYPFGSLFPWLLLAGSLELAERCSPRWLLAAGLAIGLLRAGLAAGGHVPAAYGVALAIEPAVALAAGVVAGRAAPRAGATLGQRWIGASFVLLAAAGAFHLIWLLLGRGPDDVLLALWMVVTPPTLGLQVHVASERTRSALTRARDQLEQRVAERTDELARAYLALRRSEERYRTVSELSSDFSFDFRIEPDLRLHREWVTGAFQRITGFGPEALDGHGWLDLLPGDRRDAIAPQVAAAGSGASDPIEWPIRTRAGEEKTLEINVHALREAGDGGLHVVGAARDVTATRRAEAGRRALERRVQETERLESLGRLSGGVAHDFNNLLGVILGNTRLARADLPMGAPALARLAPIQAAAEHAARLTEQMLTCAGKAPTRREVIDVSRVVGEMLELVRAALPDSCSLHTDLAPGLHVEADETQVRQVLLNLVTNAAEALEDGRGTVHLRTARVRAELADLVGACGAPDPQPGEYVLLEVRDTGHGMDAATRERIFEPFYSTRFTGRGMGLASVLGIVRRHGGLIALESAPGRGTRVRVLFPPSAAVEARPAPAAVSDAEEASGGRILVVDDDPGVRDVASEFLRREGFQVIPSSGGREAIARLRAQPDAVDAVLLDLAMPDVTGEQAFLEMRHIRPDLPVLLTTGYSEELASERFAAPGAAGFLRKPFGPEELIASLRAALRSRARSGRRG